MTTIDTAISQLVTGPLSRIDRDAAQTAQYLRRLADLVGSNRETWPEQTRLLTDETRSGLLATLQRVQELGDAMVLIIALGTPPA